MSCVAVAVALMSGCGPTLPPKPKTFLVHGTVSLNGAPVHGGAVYFVPADPENGSMEGRATISNDGTYSASTFVDQQGLVPGQYKVWIEEYNFGVHGKLDGEPTKIPKKYQSVDTSELKYPVKAEDNTIDINLE
jgi:hypothetical protein